MILEAKDISVERKGSQPLRFQDLSIVEGEKIILLGPSGSGKTTFLSVLAGLLNPTQGNINLHGHNLYGLPEHERDKLRGREFGFIFQTLHLLPSLTVRQNIVLAASLAGKKDEDRVDDLLGNLGLMDKSDRKPDALSQGEQQRAAIARAVINNPSVIIADEPTSALDDANAFNVMRLLESQAEKTQAALLVATHDNRISNRFDKIISLNSEVKHS